MCRKIIAMGIGSASTSVGRIFVQSDDTVVQGQPTAEVGSTVRSTSPHLHFKICLLERGSEPLAYLPTQTAQQRQCSINTTDEFSPNLVQLNVVR